MDNSEAFINEARRRQTSRVQFQSHDITRMPLPGAPVDFIFCRFLLTHMRHVFELVERWANHLKPGETPRIASGLLLIEELEDIEPRTAAFRTYLSIIEAMLWDQSLNLYIGRDLSAMTNTGAYKVLENRIDRLNVDDRDAATMFAMNIPQWRDRPFIRERYGKDRIDALREELEALANRPRGQACTAWSLRQIMLKRT